MCSQTRWLGLMAIALAVGSFPASPGQTVSRGLDPMQQLLRAEPRCPRTSSSGTAVAAPCVRTLGSLRGGCGAERSEVVIEGPRALPGPTFHDMFGLAGAEGGDAEGSGDEAEEDSHVTGGVRAALRATALTPEERASFFEQWQDDSRWTNLTLMPLTHGEEMPEELQWEQERLHGDLALYRRTFIPTPTYLKWKASEDARAAARSSSSQRFISFSSDSERLKRRLTELMLVGTGISTPSTFGKSRYWWDMIVRVCFFAIVWQ